MSSGSDTTGEMAAPYGVPLELAVVRANETVSHNLNGQRLGRKGRETRERIVRVAIEMMLECGEEPFTLSGVARRASLGMSSLYTYFTDISELMVAVLEPVTSAAQQTYLALLADYWPDAQISLHCQQFWASYADFWSRNAPILHQRNRMSDAGDELMLACRVEAGMPLIRGICRQLCAVIRQKPSQSERAMASVIATMMERTITVQSQPNYRAYIDATLGGQNSDLGAAGARLLVMAVRNSRGLTA